MSGDLYDAVREAERIVWAEGWHLREQAVIDWLVGTAGLARARLDPRSEVVQLVAYDGVHIGHVRRETGSGSRRRWVAVMKYSGQRIGSYPAASAAAAALARACGFTA